MSIKKTLLAAALAAFAFTALPAVASAVEVDLPENPEFTVEGGETRLVTPESEVKCTSVEEAGTNKFESSSGGTVKLKFNGCKAFSTNCKSAGAANGVIETTALPFDIVTLTTQPSGVRHILILITSNSNHFATFTCAFGLAKIEVTGNGVLGEITNPGVEELSNSMTLNFETDENDEQVFNEAMFTGGENKTYGLEASTNGGEPEPAGQDGVGTASFVEGGEGQITLE